MVENITGRPFAFSMIPCRGQLPYFLEAFSQQQRVDLSSSSFLTQRICGCASSPSSSFWCSVSAPSGTARPWPPSTTTSGCKTRWVAVATAWCASARSSYRCLLRLLSQKTGEMCAVKLINKKKVDPEVLQHELTVLRSLIVSIPSVSALNRRTAFARPTSCGS